MNKIHAHFGGIRDAHLFIYLYFFFAQFVFVLCLVYLILPVSLDYPLLISTSVISNVSIFHKIPIIKQNN